MPTATKPQVVTLRFFIAAKKLMSDYQNWIEMDKVSVSKTSPWPIMVTCHGTDMGYVFNREWMQLVAEQKSTTTTTAAVPPCNINDIITNGVMYPCMATCTFQIFRTTKPSDEATVSSHPTSRATWWNIIKGYSQASDVLCMRKEYGYDLSAYDDALLHSRMLLQMPPFTEDTPSSTAGCRGLSAGGTIRAYFVPADVQCMKGQLGLLEKMDAVAAADTIHEQVATG